MHDAARTLREQTHDALDDCLDALDAADRTGAAGVKWAKALLALCSAIVGVAKQRRYGRAVLDATFGDGLPVANKAIEAGFLTSVK